MIVVSIHSNLIMSPQNREDQNRVNCPCRSLESRGIKISYSKYYFNNSQVSWQREKWNYVVIQDFNFSNLTNCISKSNTMLSFLFYRKDTEPKPCEIFVPVAWCLVRGWSGWEYGNPGVSLPKPPFFSCSNLYE
jgi:hypothetical protein